MYKIYTNKIGMLNEHIVKIWLIMRLTTVILIATLMQVSASSLAQRVTLNQKKTSLEKIFREIHNQTGYDFLYNKDLLDTKKSVNIIANNEPLEIVLEKCLADQSLGYSIENKMVIIIAKEKSIFDRIVDAFKAMDVSGKVTDENGSPLVGATVKVKNTNISAFTDLNGNYLLKNISEDATLTISYTGYITKEVRANLNLVTALKIGISQLEEVTINKGYYTTSQKLNTGSVTKVTGEEIDKQPVSNPISALQGRVPGLLITQKNGLPGSTLAIQIRGQNSIQQGNDPLIIIDGVPFSSENLARAGTGLNANSPFNTINPSDIESIEVLKDADATAIYGSRGANGVLLITTKKAKAGKMSINTNFSKGLGTPTRTMDFMDTKQYIEMRNEAFKNDGVVPSSSDAPDLALWDNNRYTDWKKLILTNTSDFTNLQARISGGTKFTNYSLSTGYYSEGSVLPGNNKNKRGSVSLNVSNMSNDEKFSAILSSSYTIDDNNLSSQDLTAQSSLPPNMYAPYDSNGKLQWSDAGYSYGNPFSVLLEQYNATSKRLIANAILNYKILPKISIKSNFNYNMVEYNQYSSRPISSQDPAYDPKGSAEFNKATSNIWNIEPQVDYNTHLFSKGTFQVLIGGTLQQKKDDGTYVYGSGYTNDIQIASIAGAATSTVENDYSLYKFSSLYGRLNYNWDDKYILNIVARQDASSRFGTSNRLAKFGAVGIAWVFSKERLIKDNFPALSFGKFKASFGTTGNDRIGDYKYLDTWINTTNSYQGIKGIRPTRLFNENYSWEQIKKLDVGADLGFFKDRILVTVDLFRHRSTNQLISYSLPDQTGFTNIIRNIPAIIQNKGIEMLLTTVNLKGKNFSWKSSFNLTVQRNKLLEFSALENSNYASTYIIGKPVNISLGYTYLGIDRQTGIYQFDDKNKDGILNTLDYSYQGTTDPKFFGGLTNTVQFKNMELSFLVEFREQVGRHAIFGYSSFPGSFTNQPVAALDRWQKPGDESTYQKYTQAYGTPAADAASRMQNSGAALTDASFIRLKNLSLSYIFPERLLGKMKIESCKLFLQSQNLFTITNYVGADPENQNLQVLPPLRVITAGININF
ncbi:MAG: SusC/RagA family TonB-linked outer membrane protein [Pedobacter sp.]|jgi:TonB-linked SusC/RagA family outer membrane protein|uniref:SusC/RagA family TonB-linked outer membrane protein n=1 Tax=Pedobacter sp. TaxID=1411316 RepID=UPI00356ABA24